MFWRCGASIPYLSHAKLAIYHLSYIPVPFKLWAIFWTKSMLYQLSICNELSISSHYQQTPHRIVEASKSFGDAGHRSTHLSHAKRALCHFCYVPVLFKLRAIFWTKSMIYQLSICNELSIPSHYQQTPNRIVEASKSFGDAGHRSPYLSHAKQALYHLSYITVPFKRWAIFWTKSMYISFRFVTSCQFLPIISKHQIESSKPQKVLEMRGIDPRTSRMRSKRSTIWATSPYPSSFELSSEQNPCISAFDL